MGPSFGMASVFLAVPAFGAALVDIGLLLAPTGSNDARLYVDPLRDRLVAFPGA